MPALREWAVNFPKYWTPAQAKAFMGDTSTMLMQAIYPALQAVGPLNGVSILLSVIAQITRSNLVYAHDIQGAMARAYDLVDQMRSAVDKAAGEKKH